MSSSNENNVQIAILAGGQGARFWPLSRMSRPKQFLSISKSGESLIQATARRTRPVSADSEPFVVTNVQHVPLLNEHVPDAKVIVEPVGRNTAPAIGLAAVYIRKVVGGDPVNICLPADHAVKDEAVLCETLTKAVECALASDSLVTIGIEPTFANTAYGYIHRGEEIAAGSYKVGRFYEKPNQARADKYFASGEYYWNSGMFVWRSSVILAAIEQFLPDLHAGLLEIEAAIGTASEAEVIARVFEGLESVSIDFGVLEHAKNCVVVPGADFGWNDVGSWDAWAEHFQTDDQGNLVKGNAQLIEATNCVVYANEKHIAILGADDLVVIDSGDALLICPRAKVQDVKKIVVELKDEGRTDLV